MHHESNQTQQFTEGNCQSFPFPSRVLVVQIVELSLLETGFSY